MDKRSSARVVKIAEKVLSSEMDWFSLGAKRGTVIWTAEDVTPRDIKAIAASVLAQARGKP